MNTRTTHRKDTIIQSGLVLLSLGILALVLTIHFKNVEARKSGHDTALYLIHIRQ